MKLTKVKLEIKKRDGAPRRARNSLSRKKFIDRLNKGLPIFAAYGKSGSIYHHHDCRNLHYVKWRTGPSGGTEFVTITRKYPTSGCVDHIGLTDMNVERNIYNRTFVFRTKVAAEQYLAEGI